MSEAFRNTAAVSLLHVCLLCSCCSADQNSRAWTAKQAEFFETRIRPVLVERCYECHNSADAAEGGLAVDFRDGFRKGGDTGPAFIPGQANASRLAAILRHDIEGLEMPQGGPRLEDSVIADFEKWIADGAADPRDQPPSAKELAEATAWTTLLTKRKQWWSFQPIREVRPPDAERGNFGTQAIDRFIFNRLRDADLAPVELADPAVIIRRLYFTLTGLPPTADELQHWTVRFAVAGNEKEQGTESRQRITEELTDGLLNSPRFGERWARHWMDWIRYAESHGSEGDPEIVQAAMYRDYLIRALNADVPTDQLIREHVAGDLLVQPRLNHTLGINESAIGPAHWRMVFHGFAPTDALDEKVRFIDDQINTFSKAFLGLTVSCTRCHDHKFDPISQRDYYALFGILSSCRPGRTVVDLPEHQTHNIQTLQELKRKIREALATAWLAQSEDLQRRIAVAAIPQEESRRKNSVLYPLFVFRQQLSAGPSAEQAWAAVTRILSTAQQSVEQTADSAATGDSANVASGKSHHWNLADDADFQQWFRSGVGLPSAPSPAGEFVVADKGEAVLKGILPAGVFSHTLTDKHPARLMSADLKLPADMELLVRCI
ncbi:MAG: DUF1549 domain-containing protein, partial [Planctomycetaceae bacterium]|nr:DUF1549 domain-containing protein [Planctomycetaceae bacterium]